MRTAGMHLASEVDAFEAGRVGDELLGAGDWSGGVLAADGIIYGVPLSAT